MFFSKKPAPVPAVDPIAEFDRVVSKAIAAALANVDHSDFKWSAPRWVLLSRLAQRLASHEQGLRGQLAYRPQV